MVVKASFIRDHNLGQDSSRSSNYIIRVAKALALNLQALSSFSLAKTRFIIIAIERILKFPQRASRIKFYQQSISWPIKEIDDASLLLDIIMLQVLGNRLKARRVQVFLGNLDGGGESTNATSLCSGVRVQYQQRLLDLRLLWTPESGGRHNLLIQSLPPGAHIRSRPANQYQLKCPVF